MLSGLYLLLLVAAALFYVLDRSLGTDDKVLLAVGVAGLPAVAFVAVAVPLLRDSRNRVILACGAVLAVAAALVQLMLTFGFAFPLSLVLLGVAVAAANRAGRVGGMRASRRLLAVCAFVVLFAVNSVIAVLVLLGAGVVVIAAALRKLISRNASSDLTVD